MLSVSWKWIHYTARVAGVALLQCVVVYCNVLQCIAVYCSVLPCVAVRGESSCARSVMEVDTLHGQSCRCCIVAVCCSVL